MSNNKLGVTPQAYEVYDFMKRRLAITPIQALNEIGCFRLAARIYELRSAGVDVKTKTMTRMGRDGKYIHFAEYRIENDPFDA